MKMVITSISMLATASQNYFARSAVRKTRFIFAQVKRGVCVGRKSSDFQQTPDGLPVVRRFNLNTAFD